VRILANRARLMGLTVAFLHHRTTVLKIGALIHKPVGNFFIASEQF